MSDETIFISIASYRDKECPMTIKSIYENAENPKRVFVGICQQNDPSDDDCHVKDIPNSDNIRIMRISHLEAKGPTFARYHCSKLYKGEKYFMQIDSHMKFIPKWDTIVVDMYRDLKKKGDKIVLSTYPPEYGHTSNDVPVCTKYHYDDKNMPVLESVLLAPDKDYKLNGYVPAGFFFIEGKFLDDVPFDPNLPYLFMGEEILFSARLWTNGYDIYVPKTNIAFHNYKRTDVPRFWDVVDHNKSDINTIAKVKYLLGYGKLDDIPSDLRKDIDKYGMGHARTLNAYYNHLSKDFYTGKDVENSLLKIKTDFENGKTITIKKYIPRHIKITILILLFIALLFLLAILYNLLFPSH